MLTGLRMISLLLHARAIKKEFLADGSKVVLLWQDGGFWEYRD